MNNSFIPLPADKEQLQPERFVYQDTKLSPFPREKFIQFCSKLKVQSKDYGLMPFKMLGSQVYILDEICKARDEGVATYLILKARQLGASTFFLALDLFWSFEYKGILGAFITHEERSLDNFRAAIEVFFAETPKGYLVRYVRHNRNMLILKNGSKFRYLIAGTSEVRKGGLGRSGSTNFVHATEVAYFGKADDLKEFKSQTTSLYPHRFEVYESTANGFNHWSEDWEEAKRDPTKRCIFVGWWRDERNQLPVDHRMFRNFMPDGVKTPLTKIERQRVKAVREAYGFDISIQQIAWWRMHLETEKHGDLSVMDQEVPWTEEDAFQSTGSKFFTGESLTSAVREARKHPVKAFRYKLGHEFKETKVIQVADPTRAELKIWEEASPYGNYVMGADPSYGSSDYADRSVASVWRIFSDCMYQVAEFVTPSASTYQFAWVIAHLAGYYGKQWIMPILEINGPGKAVFAELQRIQRESAEIKPMDNDQGIRNILGHMKNYLYRRIDSPSGGGLVYHFISTEVLKRFILNQFKDSFELERAKVRSIGLLEEMRKVVNNDGSIGGDGGSKDDRVIAAALADHAYQVWGLPRMKGMGMTRAKANQIDERGGTEPVDRLIVNFLRKQSISVPTR